MATGRDLAEQLLRRAADDEAAVRAMLPLESVADLIVGFHAQQVVEKCSRPCSRCGMSSSRSFTTLGVSRIFARRPEQVCRSS
jgi:hypothetical protein